MSLSRIVAEIKDDFGRKKGDAEKARTEKARTTRTVNIKAVASDIHQSCSAHMFITPILCARNNVGCDGSAKLVGDQFLLLVCNALCAVWFGLCDYFFSKTQRYGIARMPCHSSSVEDSLCSSNICDVCYVSACISRRAYKLVSTIKRIGCHIVAQLQKLCLISKFYFSLLTT